MASAQYFTKPNGKPARFGEQRYLAATALLIAGLVASASVCSAQEALRTPEMREAVPEALRQRQENPDYLFKWHDIRFQARPSLTLEWNDNIGVAQRGQKQEDFIIRPMVDFSAFYPITSWNALKVSMGVGYDQYVDHDDWSQIRLEQRSAIEFDFMVKDWLFNVHDRFEDILDPAREASFAGPNQRFGGLQNMAGASATWPLKDLVFTVGYDHFNFWSSFEDTEYLDRSSELPIARIGYRFVPNLTAGVEGTYTYTTYDQRFLNDHSGYSAGVYGDWQPGQNFRIQPRAGYVQYFYRQTSLILRAEDQSAWYSWLSATHLVTDTISYMLSVGHELRPGSYGDTVEDWYVLPSVTWNLLKNASINASMNYETGTQSSRNVSEDYDWLGAGVGVSYQFIKNLSTSLNYRHTIRESSTSDRKYNQNLISLTLAYQF